MTSIIVVYITILFSLFLHFLNNNNYVFYTFFHSSISWHGLWWKNGIKQLPTNFFTWWWEVLQKKSWARKILDLLEEYWKKK